MNVDNFSTMGFYGGAFMASLVAFCGLYVAYFFTLNLFELLALAAGLGSVVFLLGRQTLVIRRAHMRRLMQQ
jgi:hypothetical protein